MRLVQWTMTRLSRREVTGSILAHSCDKGILGRNPFDAARDTGKRESNIA